MEQQVVDLLGKMLDVLNQIQDILLDFDAAYLEEGEEEGCDEEEGEEEALKEEI